MDLMNFGLSEMIFIFLLALLLFGPKKMPEIGRQIGRALNEFRRASNEFKSQIESEIQNLERESSAGEILPPAKTRGGRDFHAASCRRHRRSRGSRLNRSPTPAARGR